MERCMLQALGHPATYENLLDEMDQSPFAQAIINTTMAAKFRALNFSKFNRTTDSHEHICQYQQVMLVTSMLKESRDALLCKLFSQSLKGNAIKWFCQLGTGSFASFKDLTKTFLENYSVNIYIGTTHEEFFSIIQEPTGSQRPLSRHQCELKA
ncbi:hypothetical protein TIFTF001_040471 [Ficus carica]|uniref:Retrotransposon gag domain-containing protein n=1 Tax=Ficus carica TaxID=3494 RepID=A0AA87Z1T3_FICCA|nr:hypothetical protein TIFTF001_040471 [Ficus carica]